MATLDIPRMVKRFGGRRQLAERAARAGFPRMTVGMIDKWHERGSMPLYWLLVIHLLAEIEGNPINLYDYIKKGEQHDGTNGAAVSQPEQSAA